MRKDFFKYFKRTTAKQDAVIELLEKDIDMPTSKIIKKIHSLYSGSVQISKRQVQRIRKQIRRLERDDKMNKNDENVFDVNVIPDSGWEKDLIDTVNYSIERTNAPWSIQELATSFGVTEDEIRKTVKMYDMFILAEIIDEDEVKTDNEVGGSGGVVEEVNTNADINVFTNNQNDGFWEVEIDCVNECSKAPKSVDVIMSQKARKVAMLYMGWAKAREWLAYLVGHKREDGSYIVEDLYLPDQRTCSTLVDNVNADNYNEMRIIGVIHSHHEMGAGDENSPSFSGHDDNFINGNHNLSLLAGRDRKTGGFKIVGIARTKTPCGSLIRVKASVKLIKKEMTDEEKTLKKDFFEKTQTQAPRYIGNVKNHCSIAPVNDYGSNIQYGNRPYHFSRGGWPGNQFNQGQNGQSNK